MDFCKLGNRESPSEGLKSRLSCFEDPNAASSASAFTSAASAASMASVWYCEARHLLINMSAISLGSSDLSVPTSSQKGLWKARALAKGFEPRTAFPAFKYIKNPFPDFAKDFTQ